jgi:hypothetical protein
MTKSNNNKRCDNCNRRVTKRVLEDQDDYNAPFFMTLCIKCINTCNDCGCDVGYPSHSLLSGFECSFCDHNSCRSCGINIQCDCGCEEVACEDCSDTMGMSLCAHLKKKFIMLKHYRRIMSEK